MLGNFSHAYKKGILHFYCLFLTFIFIVYLVSEVFFDNIVERFSIAMLKLEPLYNTVTKAGVLDLSGGSQASCMW